MLKTLLLSTAALALVATAANAGSNVTLSHDNRFVSTMPSKGSEVVPPGKHKVRYLSTTLASNPEGTYFCCYGSTISGPSSFLGHAYGAAEQFVPAKSKSITTLSAAVGYSSGTKAVTLTLYADNGSNSPGAALASATGTAAVQFGLCCGVTSVTIPSTSLTAGTPYWIGITTTGTNFNAAPFQVSDEVDNETYISSTSNGGTTWGAGVQETEYNPAIGVK